MRQGLYVLLGILLVPTVGLVGDVVTDGKFVSTTSTGAPLEVASSDMVVNLNADKVDGVEGTDLYTKTEVDALVAAAAAADSRRWFYLVPPTPLNDGANALTACDAGFHMASIFELLDVSNLRYDTGRGVTKADSGQGPPADLPGWVRTGGGGSTANQVGGANCNAWTSSSAAASGTVAALGAGWLTSPSTGWQAATTTCNTGSAVWCIED